MKLCNKQKLDMAKKFNDLVGCRVRLTLSTEDHTIQVRNSSKLRIDKFNVELTSHGVTLLNKQGNYAEPLYNNQIDNEDFDIFKVMIGDDNYTYWLIDVESIAYVKEANSKELGALIIKNRK